MVISYQFDQLIPVYRDRHGISITRGFFTVFMRYFLHRFRSVAAGSIIMQRYRIIAATIVFFFTPELICSQPIRLIV